MLKRTQVFYTVKNTLSDDSVIYEVWQHGSEQRLASADNDLQAEDLASRLNKVLTVWVEASASNTVDV